MINEARVRFRQGRPLITRTKNLSHLHYRSGLAQAPRVDGARTSSGNTGGGKGGMARGCGGQQDADGGALAATKERGNGRGEESATRGTTR